MPPSRSKTTHNLLRKKIGAVLKKLEEDKHALEVKASKKLQPLYTRWNTIAPISKLPPDLFGEILIFISVDSTDYRQLLPVTWVCQSWRQIACGFSPYWSHRNLSRGPWPAQLLSRCKTYTPITAQATLDSIHSLSLISAAFRQLSLHKFRSIDISITRGFAKNNSHHDALVRWDALKDCIQRSSPSLYLLSLDSHNDTILEPLLNSYVFPCMKNLRLSYGSLYWNSSLFSSTVLHLTLDKLPFEMAYSLEPLYRTLRRMLLLRSLTLTFQESDENVEYWSTSDYTTPTDSDPRPEVILRFLRKLELRGDLCLIAKILGEIDIGPDAKLNIVSVFNPSRPRLKHGQPPIRPGDEYSTLLHNIAWNCAEFKADEDAFRTVELLGPDDILCSTGTSSMKFVAYTRRVLPLNYGRAYLPLPQHPGHLLFEDTAPICVIQCEDNARQVKSENHHFRSPEWDFVSRFLYTGFQIPQEPYSPWTGGATDKYGFKRTDWICHWPAIRCDAIEVLHLGGSIHLNRPNILLRPFSNIRILTIQGVDLLANILPILVDELADSSSTRSHSSSSTSRRSMSTSQITGSSSEDDSGNDTDDSQVSNPKQLPPIFPHLETIVCDESLSSRSFYSHPDTPREQKFAYKIKLVKVYKDLAQLIVKRSRTDVVSNRSSRKLKRNDNSIGSLKKVYVTPKFQVIIDESDDAKWKEQSGWVVERLREVGNECGTEVVVDQEWLAKK